MLSGPTMLSRRSVLSLAAFVIFIGALLLASRRLEGLCIDGIYCRDAFNTVDRPYSHEDAHKTENDEFSSKAPASNNHTAVATATISGPALSNPTSTTESDCAGFPETSNILLIMKTGASEAFARIPTQAITNLRCLPEFLIFSDMGQDIGGYEILDSLDNVLTSVKSGNQDFNIYFRQRECAADQEGCNKDENTASEGWALDKYKNVHIAEKTFKMRPDYDWYLFVDADTYVVWPNLVEWLKKLDPTEPMYFGSVAMLGDFPFGHGGSGYVVSKTAMRDFFEGKTNVANHWDEDTKEVCCGDYMFAKALKDATGIEVNNTWPYINGEKPYTIPYSQEEWCQPITTMHHVGSEELSDLDAFERDREFEFPLRFKDLYHRFVAPKMIARRLDWDNFSDEVIYLDPSSGQHDEDDIKRAKTNNLSELESRAHWSADDCQAACSADGTCLQYQFYRGICGLSPRIKHGHPTKREEEDKDKRISGWDVDKIDIWVKEHEKCDRPIEWPLVPT